MSGLVQISSTVRAVDTSVSFTVLLRCPSINL